jgi:tRNA (cmo5U34)-methyltransferase
LISQAAVATNPGATDLLDVGCGAGNYSLKLLQRLPDLNVALIDLSRPMLERAEQRLRPATKGRIEAFQGDVRDLDLGEARFDVIVAAAVLHHLRTAAEWEAVLATFFKALRPSGSIWISDLIAHSSVAIQDDVAALRRVPRRAEGRGLSRHRLRLRQPGRHAPAADVRARPAAQGGFRQVEILHKTSVFAAFGAWKSADRIARFPSGEEDDPEGRPKEASIVASSRAAIS